MIFREWTSRDLALVEALDLVEPWGPERLDMAVAQLTQVVYGMLSGKVLDLETLTGRTAVLVSRKPAQREGASGASVPTDETPAAAQAFGKLVASGIPFKVAQHGNDRQPGTGPEGEG